MRYGEYIERAKTDRMASAVLTTASLLLEKKLDELKMTDIAKECDIGVASLYRYFGTKTRIVIEAGTLLWQDMRGLFDGVFECGYYTEKSGLEQLRELMKVFKVMYASHKGFLIFLADFDRMVLSDGVGKAELSDYENSVLDFFSLFSDAFEKGREDGSIGRSVDFPLMYKSVTHALMLMSEKFAQGEILSGDDFDKSENELDFVIEMAINFIKA